MAGRVPWGGLHQLYLRGGLQISTHRIPIHPISFANSLRQDRKVQEDFAWGIAGGLNTARGAEVVSAKTAETMRNMSKKTAEVTKDWSAAATTK
eukprot:scaffold131660_cov27-Prasinocladus_malaysianus.AAC.1